MTFNILTINAGSSSVKCALYGADNLERIDFCSVATLDEALDWSHQQHFEAAGHRIVHGGSTYSNPVLIDDQVMTDLRELIPLAPLHEPYNLKAITVLRSHYPKLPQIACFDTAFHTTQKRLARLYPLPRAITDEGVLRYGFHGLSYAYIASVLPKEIAEKKVIVMHLGNGASMCAMHNRLSVASSMGFTALDGLMMGTRPGTIDPGILLYLQQEKQMSVKDIEDLLYRRCGLLGVSGISNDMQKLLASTDPHAKEAIDLFCYRAACEIGSLTAAMGGVEVLIFTGGIGEHAAAVRAQIGALSAWLGIEIDDGSNRINGYLISTAASRLPVYVIPTDEELMIATYTRRLTSHSLT